MIFYGLVQLYDSSQNATVDNNYSIDIPSGVFWSIGNRHFNRDFDVTIFQTLSF